MMKSFVKWAGGKYQLLDEINEVIDSMRESHDEFIYVEPFVGGGAILFNILERCSNLKYAIINDINKGLITCYRVLSCDYGYKELKILLNELQGEYNNSMDKKAFYENKRRTFNSYLKDDVVNDAELASLFIFLNKTSFNGIYRENSKGEFNVPWNQKESINLYDEENFDRIHNFLKEKVIILNGDYQDTDFAIQLARVENCGLIYYFDPPYRPLEGTKSFVGYTKSGFHDEDQVRLKEYCDKINDAGYDFVLSNSKSENYFEDLYKGYEIDVVKARRNINSNGEGRGKIDELLIYNRKKHNVGLF